MINLSEVSFVCQRLMLLMQWEFCNKSQREMHEQNQANCQKFCVAFKIWHIKEPKCLHRWTSVEDWIIGCSKDAAAGCVPEKWGWKAMDGPCCLFYPIKEWGRYLQYGTVDAEGDSKLQVFFGRTWNFEKVLHFFAFLGIGLLPCLGREFFCVNDDSFFYTQHTTRHFGFVMCLHFILYLWQNCCPLFGQAGLTGAGCTRGGFSAGQMAWAVEGCVAAVSLGQMKIPYFYKLYPRVVVSVQCFAKILWLE